MSNGTTAKSIIAGLFAVGVCKNCRGKLDGGNEHLCAACTESAAHAAGEQLRSNAEFKEAERQRPILAAALAAPAAYRDLRFAAATLKSRLARREAIDAARKAIGAPVVTITGQSGSGKTSLAAAMFGDVIDRAITGEAVAEALAATAMWTSAVSLARARREHPLGQGDAPLVVRARTASLLVIDDVGMERDYDCVGGVLYERHADGLATIATTGFDLAEIGAKYGDGIARRMLQKGQAIVIRCEGA